jgi:hypothetical protein
MTQTSTPEQQHLARLERNPIYAEAWKKKHAHQQIQCESPLSNGRHANATPIIEALNSNSTGDSFFNTYWFGLLVIVVFLVAVWLTG